jgi:hypothetical protein
MAGSHHTNKHARHKDDVLQDFGYELEFHRLKKSKEIMKKALYVHS